MKPYPLLLAILALPCAAQDGAQGGASPEEARFKKEFGDESKNPEESKDLTDYFLEKEAKKKAGLKDGGIKDPDGFEKKLSKIDKEKDKEIYEKKLPGAGKEPPPREALETAPDGAPRPRSSSAAPPPLAPQQAEEQTRRQTRAVTRARAMGETLRNTFSAQDLPSTPLKPGTEGVVSSNKPPASAAALNPSAPKNQADFLLASISGFAGSFKAVGLRVERGRDGAAAILNRAGEPASGAELAALGAHIQGEPEALMRRPDFFDVVPREHFTELKEDYRTRPDLRQTSFKDIELSREQRDFQRSASCQKMSGNCNPNTVEMSYRKGEMVSPEDLNLVYGSINAPGDDDDAEELGSGEFDENDQRAFDAAKSKSDFARKMLSGGRFSLAGIEQKFKDFFGLAGADAAGGGAAPVWAQDELGTPGRRGKDQGSAVGFTAGARGRKGALPPPSGPPKAERPSWLWLLLAAGAALASFGARSLRR